MSDKGVIMLKTIIITATIAMTGMPVMANQAQDNAMSFILGVIIGNSTKSRPTPEFQPEPQPQHYCTGRTWVQGEQVWVPETTKWVNGHTRRNGTWKRGHWETYRGYWVQENGHYKHFTYRCD